MKTSIIIAIMFAFIDFSQAQMAVNESSLKLENLATTFEENSSQTKEETVLKLEKSSVITRLTNHLAATVKYPEIMFENQIEGTVWIRLTISEDGTIVQSRIIGNESAAFDKEVLKAMDSFMQNGVQIVDNQVVSSFDLPVNFSLK